MFGYYNKKLDSSLRSLLKEGNHLNLDQRLTVWANVYFTDFEVKLDEKLVNKINEAVINHIENFEQYEIA
jgi:hypothetical protein